MKNIYELKNLIKRKEIIINLASILLIVSLLIGTSYSAFLWSESSNKEQTLVAGTFALSIDDTSPTLGGIISINNAYPMNDENGVNSEVNVPYKFKIQNTGDMPITYTVKLENDEIMIENDLCSTNLLDDSNVKINISGDSTLETTTLNSVVDNVILTGTLEANTEKSVSLSLWIKEDASNDIIGKHFHKKLVLDSTQILPLNYENSREVLTNNGTGNPLLGYRVYGNSTTTDGVTTSLGETSKNLLPYPYVSGISRLDDGVKFTVNSNGSINIVGNNIGNAKFIFTNEITLPAGNYIANGNQRVRIYADIAENSKTHNFTSGITLSESTTYSRIYLIVVGTGEINETIFPQLEEGTQPTEYRPYRYIDVESSVKNILPIRTSSKTFNGLSINYDNIDNTFVLNGTLTLEGDIPLLEQYTPIAMSKDKTYRFSVTEVSGSATLGSGSGITYAYSVFTSDKSKFIRGNTNNNSFGYYVFTSLGISSTNGFYLFLQCWRTGTVFDNYKIKIQLEEGSTSTSYEPYFTPITTTIDLTGHDPLRSLGEVRDYIEYPTNKLVRKIGVRENGELYVLDDPIKEDITLPTIATHKGTTNISIPYGGTIAGRWY